MEPLPPVPQDLKLQLTHTLGRAEFAVPEVNGQQTLKLQL